MSYIYELVVAAVTLRCYYIVVAVVPARLNLLRGKQERCKINDRGPGIDPGGPGLHPI